MLDIKRIREKETEVREGLKNRNANLALLDDVIALDKQRRERVTDVESLKSERNAVSKEVGHLKKAGQNTDATQAEMRTLGDRIAVMDQQVRDIEAAMDHALMMIPNIPHSSLPIGADKYSNIVTREHGRKRSFDFKPRNHIELCETLGLVDFARGTRMTGSGFPCFTGKGARLVRGLLNFMLDMHVDEHGYRELWPPAVVNTAAMTGTGQLPKMAEDMYHATDDLWLIPTAEVPVTNFYMQEIIDQPLPIFLTAYTPCFRREAGAAGKETRGLIRVHQFDKVEMVKFVTPETSYAELETLVKNAEDVLERLGLYYRILSLCTGDISFSAAKCYDIELWAPGQDEWLEVSSCSNFEDFQARRAGIRYRDDKGKTRFVHTLNGSGVAVPRLFVAILENYQQADGTVLIPDALVPYMSGMKRLEQ